MIPTASACPTLHRRGSHSPRYGADEEPVRHISAVILVLAVLTLVAPYVISAMRRKPRVVAENV